jgi:hypothetical protein
VAEVADLPELTRAAVSLVDALRLRPVSQAAPSCVEPAAFPVDASVPRAPRSAQQPSWPVAQWSAALSWQTTPPELRAASAAAAVELAAEAARAPAAAAAQVESPRWQERARLPRPLAGEQSPWRPRARASRASPWFPARP